MGDESKRTVVAASGLVHAHQPGGVSHSIDHMGGGAPPCFEDNKETISLSCTVGVSHIRWNPLNLANDVSQHKGHLVMRVPNSRWLKIKAA